VGTQRPLAAAGAGPGLNSRIPFSWSLVALTHGASSGYQGLGFDVLADAAPVVVVDVWREEHRLQKPRQ
jgi:hypothetical protein